MFLAQVWAVIVSIWTWMWANKKIAIYIILAGVIAFLTWKNNSLTQKNTILTEERGKLPDNIEFIASLKDTDFKVTYRDSKNNVIVKEYYIPKEGSITVTKYVDLRKYDPKSGLSDKTNMSASSIPSISFNPLKFILNKITGKTNAISDGSTGIAIKNFGLCSRLGLQGFYSNYDATKPVNMGIDMKLLYANRASAGIGTTLYAPNIWLSYHLDQFIPFLQVDNAEGVILYSKPYNDFGKNMIGIGIRSNL